MKRKALGIIVAAVAALPVFVNADEVGNAKFKECLTSTMTKTCTLTENVTVNEQLDVAGNIKLDLNGYSVTAAENLEIPGGLITVLHGGTLTIEDAKGNGKITTGDTSKVYSPLQMTKKDKTDVSKKATLIVNGGHLEGYYYAVCGNGNPDRINTEVVINSGKLSVTSKTGTAIYQPQVGKTIVNGGEIKGATGIEVRSGELEVNGGTIIGTEKPVTVTPNGNGTTSIGAGIAVAQHTTKNDIKVVINGGTIQGFSALYESNPQKNSAEDIAKIKITVKDGNLEAINEGTEVVYSENKLITVEGGNFNEELSEDIVMPEGTKSYEVITLDGEFKHVVIEEEKVEEGYFGLSFEREALEEIENEELKETLKEVDKALADKYTAAIYYEIVYGDLIDNKFVLGTEISELKENIEVTLDLPENLAQLKEGYNRVYKVIRVHYNEETKKYETDILDVKEVKDGKVTFETDKFSTYVLAYEDVKAETTTNTTKNPNTFDGISLYMIIASISFIGLASVITYSKKAKNN